MGPKVRYLGPDVPAEDLIWQDPIPKADDAPIDAADVAALKAEDRRLPASPSPSWSRPPGPRPRPIAGRTTGAAPTAAASASRRRRTGTSTSPTELAKVLAGLRGDQGGVRRRGGGKKVSIADLIVLGGSVGGREGGQGMRATRSRCPSAPGRTDATAGADRRRGLRRRSSPRPTASATTCRCRFTVPTEELLIDRAQLLGPVARRR